MTYWLEAVQCALDDEGVVLDAEVVKRLAESIESAADMKSEATGELCIPSPHIAEKKEVDKRHASEMKELEQRLDLYFKEACRWAKVREDEVWMDRDGRLEWRR